MSYHSITATELGAAAMATQTSDLAPDMATIRNERIKLGCSFLNAIALTLIAFALLRPMIQDTSVLTPMSFVWVGLGGLLHGGAQVLLGFLVPPRS